MTDNISQEFLARVENVVPSVTEVRNTLQRAVKRAEEEQFKRVLIVFLDEEDRRYDLNTHSAGFCCSELVTLCEVVKSTAMEQMGY